MKALSFLSLIGLAATVAFSSCSKDDPAPVGPIAVTTYSAKIFNAPLPEDTVSASTRSAFFSSSNGTTFNFANAQAASATIDFGYFFGSAASASFASPDDYLTTVNNNYVGRRFQTRNITRFKTANIAYNIVSRNGQLDTAWNAGAYTTNNGQNVTFIAPGSRAIQLQVNNVLLAQFANGKKAIILIKDIQTGAIPSGSITFDIKVQG
jgi:hypothetical protein